MEQEPDYAYTGDMKNNDTLLHHTTDYQRIEQAIRYLEANFQNQPSLEEIAGSVHLSKYHFQKLFKRWAGISPTQFMHFLTIEYAKSRLDQSESVLDASLDAGLSSPARLYDMFVTFEAITPGEYKQKGAGLTMQYGIHPTPFGDCLIAVTDRGICALRFVLDDGKQETINQLKGEWAQANWVEGQEKTKGIVQQIFMPAIYPPQRPFHLLVRGTNFQTNVWQALLHIPPGALISYSDVARYLGKPKASRAVAAAIACNPIGYLIPCHRVISKAGRLHQYRWGASRKKAMVGWEAAQGSM